MAEAKAPIERGGLRHTNEPHEYDDNIVELYFAVRMLRQGGFLVIDDAWMPSVKATP